MERQQEPDPTMAVEAPTWPQRLVRAFWNPAEHRLRALWRLLLHALALVVVGLAVVIPLGLALALLERLLPTAAAPLLRLARREGVQLGLSVFAGGAVITAATWPARRWLDRRSFASLGLERGFARRDLASGILLSGAMMAAAFGILLACGWLRVERLAWQRSSPAEIFAWLGLYAVVFTAVGWYEELLARGYWLVNLRDGIGWRTAVAVSSSIFALGHVGNPNATTVSTVALIGAGVFLAWPVLRTGQLWMSIGLHIGWNFFEGPVFGFAVSGTGTFKLIEHRVSGPVFVTGGAFGPEAGLLLLCLQGLGALAILFVTRGRLAADPPQSASS